MTHQTLSLEKYWKLFPATLIRVKSPSSILFSSHLLMTSFSPSLSFHLKQLFHYRTNTCTNIHDQYFTYIIIAKECLDNPPSMQGAAGAKLMNPEIIRPEYVWIYENSVNFNTTILSLFARRYTGFFNQPIRGSLPLHSVLYSSTFLECGWLAAGSILKEYRIYSNKRRGANLIFRVSGAALI